jgi:large subunit ribosomal protein L21
MYAVIKAGGKQHRVHSGDVIEIELTHADSDSMQFHPILVVDDDGKAHHGKEAARAVVTAKLVGEQKGNKIKVFKYRHKTGYSRRQGHRQLMTLIEIGEIKLGGGRSRAKKAQAETPSDSDSEAERASAE